MSSSGRGKTIIVTGNNIRIAGRNFISLGDIVERGQRGSFDGVVGNGQRRCVGRELPPFTQIRITSCVDVEVTFGIKQHVQVEGDENLIDLIETEVRNGCLHATVNASLSTNNSLLVRVQMPPILSDVWIEGAGDARVDTVVQDRINLRINGSGDIRASGKVQHLHGQVRGSGDLKLRRLECHTADLTVMGSGDITSTVHHSVTAEINGSGDIVVAGKPVIQNVYVNGSGDVEFE